MPQQTPAVGIRLRCLGSEPAGALAKQQEGLVPAALLSSRGSLSIARDRRDSSGGTLWTVTPDAIGAGGIPAAWLLCHSC